MIDETQHVHTASDVETPATRQEGEGEQFFDVISWIIRLLGPRVGP